MNAVQSLARYKAWADRRFLAIVATLPRIELGAPRRIVFGSLLRTLHHSYAMDVVWQSHLLGRPHGFTSRNPDQCPALTTLMAAQMEIDAWYIAYADALAEQAWDEVVSFDFIGGGAGSLSRRDILLHVVNHTTYHRGHVADMLYELGLFPPATDYPVYLRELSAEPA